MGLDAWLTLLQAAQQISTRPWLEALKLCGSAEALVAASRRTLLEIGVAADAVAKLDKPDNDAISRWRAWLALPNRALVTFGSPGYPPRLAEIPDAPLALWVEGAELELLSAPQLAIVGSRSPTTDGSRDGRAVRAAFVRARLDDHERARDGYRRRESSRRGDHARRHGRRARQRSRRDLSARAYVARGRDRGARAARVRVRAGRRAAEAVLPATQSPHRGLVARHARRRGDAAQRLA